MTISTSKIRKIIVMRKNRKEKGTRNLELLSNPHSKGEPFSRSFLVLLARIRESVKTIEVMIKIIGVKIDKKKIIFSDYIGPFDWKSNILYTKKIINFLINKLRWKGRVIRHQQNVSITQLLQIQNDEI